jgi:hypothetical protein
MFSSLRLWTRASKRLGTFKRAKEHGLSDAEARAYSDQIYPPTAADLAYKRQLALKNTAQFPWQSMLALLYPLAAMVYFAQTPASKAAIIGYGFANLGYPVVCSRHFRRDISNLWTDETLAGFGRGCDELRGGCCTVQYRLNH